MKGATKKDDWVSVITWADLGYPHKVKALILRHPDEITEQEAVELYDLLYPGVVRDSNTKHLLIQAQLTRKGVYHEGAVSLLDYINWLPWLLSKGFDLFGLIDEGLAIEKTEVEKAKID